MHIISLSAESYWGRAPNLHPGKPQYNWLQNDLIQASNNRQNQPWIIVLMHRPFYCTCTLNSRCDTQARFFSWHFPALSPPTNALISYFSYYRSLVEDLFYQYKVDLVINGHVHNYERVIVLILPQIPLFNNHFFL